MGSHRRHDDHRESARAQLGDQDGDQLAEIADAAAADRQGAVAPERSRLAISGRASCARTAALMSSRGAAGKR